MHVNHWTGMIPPSPEGGSAAAACMSWKLAGHCQDTPCSTHTQLWGSVGLGDFDQDRVWGCQDGRGLGGPALQGSEEPSTDEEIQGSMRAGQSPNCPKTNHQILAPILARGAEPRPLLAPPTPDPACLSLKQDSYPGHTPRPPGSPRLGNPFRMSWSQREHWTRAQAWPSLPTPTPGAVTRHHQRGGGAPRPRSRPNRRQEACGAGREVCRGHQVQSPAPSRAAHKAQRGQLWPGPGGPVSRQASPLTGGREKSRLRGGLLPPRRQPMRPRGAGCIWRWV